MAIQTVKTGAAVNDGTGDDARTAFTKINQNFTDSANAASRQVGTVTGNVMEVGTFGLGIDSYRHNGSTINNLLGNQFFGTHSEWDGSAFAGAAGDNFGSGINITDSGSSAWQIWNSFYGKAPYYRNKINGVWGAWNQFLTKGNTQVDTSNGYIKGASPIIKLFADRIELNAEAKLQPITLEKLGVGDYLIKGSLGFAQEGWYIETPRDANGNVLVAVVYEQLDNNDISVKTYAKMFDEETGDIVANTAKPRDIPSTRWIDLRLQALPQEDIQPPSKDQTDATNAE